MKNTDDFHAMLKDYEFTDYKFKSKASKTVRKKMYRAAKRSSRYKELKNAFED
jgi:hypothetical protein